MTTITAGLPRTRELLDLVRGYAATPASWPQAPRFDPDSRWYARLDAGPDVEAWLLTWLPGQSTELHDHGGASGAFAVVSGVLTEYTVEEGRELPQYLANGSSRGFGPHHIHRIQNTGTEPAVSVHVYSPALSVMTRYRIDGGRLRIQSVDRAGEDW